MTIRPLSLLTAGLFFLGGFLLVLPTRGDTARDAQAQTDSALTGWSPLVGDSLLQGEGGFLRLETQQQEEHAGGSQGSVEPPATSGQDEASRESTRQRKRRRARGRLRGRVVWERSRIPVSGVGLRLYVRIDGEELNPANTPKDLDSAGSAYILIGEANCGGRGEFDLESGASKGQICLVVTAGEDCVGVFSLNMAPRPGEVFDLGDLSLEETGKAMGRVLDADGKPLKNAWVRVAAADSLLDYELDGLLLIRKPEQRIVSVPDWVREGNQAAGRGRGRTDEQGFFVVDGVPAGLAKFRVQSDQHLPHESTIEVTAGQVTDVGDVSVTEGLTLAGQLVDQRGLPVREAQISVGSSGRSLVIPKFEAHVMSRPVFSDENGRFRVAGLAEGELFVAWRPSSDFDWQVLGPFVAREDLRLHVELPYVEGPNDRVDGGALRDVLDTTVPGAETGGR